MGYRVLVSFAALVFAFSATAFVEDGGDGDGDSPFVPKIVNVELKKTYVPVGFDDNDRIQLTAAGEFADTCHKVGHYYTEIDPARKTIRVRQTAYQYFGVCVKLAVPFHQVIDVGPLKAGTWQLVDAVSGKRMAYFPVARSSKPDPDEYLYAPVTDAFVQKDPGTGKEVVTLHGTFTDRCTQLKDVKVHYYPDVVVIQPVAQHTAPAAGCPFELVRFTHTVNLADGLSAGTYLLHVRSMNGQSVSKLVDLGE